MSKRQQKLRGNFGKISLINAIDGKKPRNDRRRAKGSLSLKGMKKR
jgi:hypothetical protein